MHGKQCNVETVAEGAQHQDNVKEFQGAGQKLPSKKVHLVVKKTPHMVSRNKFCCCCWGGFVCLFVLFVVCVCVCLFFVGFFGGGGVKGD